jgi:hypothetical protein
MPEETKTTKFSPKLSQDAERNKLPPESHAMGPKRWIVPHNFRFDSASGTFQATIGCSSGLAALGNCTCL